MSAVTYADPLGAQATPQLVGALSRKVHGAAGTFDLPLALTVANPTTEPRIGPTQTVVFVFDKPVTAGGAVVTEGTAVADVPVFSGNEMIVPLTGVTNEQYVTVAVTNVVAADGGTGGSSSVRIGFLAGDVSRNRVVTLSDLGQVNAQVAQFVNATNFLFDVNASGTLSLTDKGITNSHVTKALAAVPAPANTPPQVNAGANQAITLPASANLSGSSTDDGKPGPTLTFAWSKVSGPGSASFGTATAATTSATFGAPGVYVLRLTTSDGVLSNADEVTITVNASSDPPSDPATVAPPLDPTVATNIFDATAFLYTGANPTQTGVAPGTVEARRAAVLRGGVRDGNDAPLPGVTITILGHAEFGQTLTRTDGRFDLAVNGGGVLTLNYAKSGYLPIQRQVNVPWQDYAALPDVVMIAPDSQVTAVDLTSLAPIQVAQGNPVTDADGTRRATLMFQAGTQATLTLPNGSTQPLTTLNIRATEYTVGSNGPARMPAVLPPTSGYTYAVELSADEAIAAGAIGVTFNQPLFNYVENFLAFPVGMIVPAGYYDRARGVWIPSDNGRVIKITGVSGGAAVVDTVGTGGLAPLTLSAAELEQLALLFPVGQELWRVSITHFTPWDYNWPYGPPADAIAPPAENPEDDKLLADSCRIDGNSTIECQNQILGESVGVAGTTFELHYQSERVPGRKAAFTLDIPLSGAEVPASLRRIDLEISVAGQRFAQSFAPASNRRHTFTWDGKDAYGREVQGKAEATVRVGYVYRAVYQQPAQLAQTFAAFSGTALSASRISTEVTIWNESRHSLGVLTAQVGGWSLSVHHAFDPTAKVLYEGTGERRDAQSIGGVIGTVAGGTSGGFIGDGGPATQAWLSEPQGIAVAPDGSIYIADTLNFRIRRVGPDGRITTVAGTGIRGFSGDGGPATQARLTEPIDVVVAPDGSIIINVVGIAGPGSRIRRVGLDGIITTVAGGGTSSGDGVPALHARLDAASIAVAPDGSIYVTELNGHRVRRIGANGIITTVAGNGIQGFSGDGGPATSAQLSSPFAVAMLPDGGFYIADSFNRRIRRVGPDGIITTIAGNGIQGFSGDGGPATSAMLNLPRAVAVGRDGRVYITDRTNQRIRQVRPDGIITTIVGNGIQGFSGDGGLATSGALQLPTGLAVAPDGSVYFADNFNNRIRRVAPALPGFSGVAFTIPSADGNQLYAFDASGRHLQTHNAITGAVLYQFTYDSGGRLTGVTDGYSNVTSIQRDATGNPTAIVGPFGQTTGLAVNANGYLSQITSPAGESVQIAYTPDGLLTSLTNPRGHSSSYTFDSLGRLTSAADPTGAITTISRTGTNADSTVAITSALGRVNAYRVKRLGNGIIELTVTDSAGAQSQSVIGKDGTRTITYRNGTVARRVLGPDPRWGMQAPVIASMTVTTPGGKLMTRTSQRGVTLANPNDPLSLQTMNETVTINGRTYTSSYDAASRTFTQTAPTGRQATSVVDLLGMPVQAQFGGLAPIASTYDGRGRLATNTQGSGAQSRTTTLAYGADGFLQSFNDAANGTLSIVRDANGRIVDLAFSDGGVTHFGYDANSNVTTLTPPGRPDHAFSYTQRNQVSVHTAPVVDAQNSQTHAIYDADRMTLQIDRPGGQSVGVQYDSAGRLSLVDIASGDTSFIYDASGRLASLSRDQGAALGYTYDGGLPTGTTWSGAITGSVNYAYDNDFRITSLSVNGANPIAYAYDLDGLPVQVGNLTLTRSAPNGLITGTALGTTTDAITYDVFGDTATYTASRAGSAVYATTYTRDTLGRIATKSETINGTTLTFAYSYDLAGRLTEVRQNGNLTGSYSYDANGNLLSRNDSGGTTNATYDDQDRLHQFGSTTYVHNANGERQSKTAAAQTTSYTYDTVGNLTGVTLPGATQIEYLLDGGQRRVGKKINGVQVQGFLYQDGLKPIAELDANNNVVSRFVYATGVNVPDYMIKAGATYRIITDHLGSPRLVIDSATGAIVQRLNYDEFGNVILDTSPGFQPFGFAGGIYDRDTSLVHFGVREFDPQTARWSTMDPIGFNGGDGNLYAYAANDPINLVDYTGFEPGDPFNSEQDAAYDALKSIIQTSVKKQHEYYGYVYKDRGGKYRCTPLEMTPETTGGQLPGPKGIPEGATPLGNVHTHPFTEAAAGRLAEAGKNLFSPADMKGARSVRKKMFVLNNYGNFSVFDPRTNRSRILHKGNPPKEEAETCDGGEKC